MDVMFVKKEKNSAKRRVVGAVRDPSDGNEDVKIVRRRRREPSATPAANGGGEEPRQPTKGGIIKRSSKFRGVSRHRWTGRFEAHLWDKGSWNETQRKKGKQVYLGAYDEEESAARAYDLAALKYWGPTTFTNFPIYDYESELQTMQTVTKEEYLASLRRKSSGFSRGVSKYRGVARHHHNGRWEARIGRVFGNKYLYLGTYSTQEEAARAYDIAAVEYRGINAVTNFDLSTYIKWLRPGTSNALKHTHQDIMLNNSEIQNIQLPTNLFSAGDTEPITHYTPFDADELLSPIKQECMPKQIVSSKSSATALGLLLKSSIFRQLVEKNSNTIDEENNGDDARDQVDDVYDGNLFEETADFSYISTPNEENGGYYESNDQSLWNVLSSVQ